jgi:hypothetical protein
MLERKTAYVPTLTAPEAIGETFQRHVRGGTPTPAMQQAERAFRLARVRHEGRIGVSSPVSGPARISGRDRRGST